MGRGVGAAVGRGVGRGVGAGVAVGSGWTVGVAVGRAVGPFEGSGGSVGSGRGVSVATGPVGDSPGSGDPDGGLGDVGDEVGAPLADALGENGTVGSAELGAALHPTIEMRLRTATRRVNRFTI